MAQLTVFDRNKQNQLLASLRANPKFRDQVDIALRRRIGQATTKHLTDYYASAVDNVERYLTADGGIGDGESPVSSLAVSDPAGGLRRAPLQYPWQPLSDKYREYKEATGSTAGYWRFLGLVADDFTARVRDAARRPIRYTSKVEQRAGKLAVRFRFTLPSLPEPYDGLIRRSFLDGAAGKDAEFVANQTDAFGNRNGPNRVLLAESRRPLVIPIANRMGRLMAQYLKRRF